MSSVQGVIFQCALKVSIELPETFRHHHDTTERLLKVKFSPNKTNSSSNV